jgi:hypothetical protein
MTWLRRHTKYHQLRRWLVTLGVIGLALYKEAVNARGQNNCKGSQLETVAQGKNKKT